MDNATKLLQRIREEGIKPTPRWVFTGMSYLTWGGFILSIIFGAIAFSIILFAIQQADFSITAHIGHSRTEMVLGLLPFIWLVLVFVFLGLSVLSIKKSGKGYKLRWARVVNLSVIMSVVLGTLVFIAGGAQKLETAFGKNLPGYESINERKIQMWNNPEQGYLAGEIILAEGDLLRIKSFDDREWRITFDQAFIAPILGLKVGEQIKLIGTMEGQNRFKANEIRPWGGNRMRGNFGPGRNGQNGKK